MANSVRIGSKFDDNISGPLAKLRDNFDRLGKNKGAQALLQGVGMQAGISATGLLTSGIDFLTDAVGSSITAASDLRESMTLAEQVFGTSADEMRRWAETGSEAFGTSTREALAFASSFGGAFQNVGVELDEAAEKSRDLTELAADMGSAFNTSSEEAANALKSGLLGESEPLKRFNVFLSESAVAAKAMEMGIVKAGGKLTEQQKVLARYALILTDTTAIQGTFGKDQDSLADSSKSLTTTMENLAAEVGTELVPHLARLATTLREEVVPRLRELGEGVDDVAPVIGGLGSAFELTRTPIDDFGVAVGTLFDVISGVKEPVEALDDLKAAILNLDEAKPLLAPPPGLRDDWRRELADAAAAVDLVPAALDRGRRAAVRIAAKTPADIAEALRDGRTTWQDAVGLLGDDLENTMTVGTEIAALKAELIGPEIAAGLKSGDPVVRAQTKDTVAVITDRLDFLVGASKIYGKDAAEKLASGLDKGGVALASWKLGQAARAAFLRGVGKVTLSASGSGAPHVDIRGGLEHQAHGGTNVRGDWSIVGEQGPELVHWPAASRVFSNQDSRAMLSGGASVTIAFNSTFPPTPEQAREIARLISPVLAREMTAGPRR